MAAAVMQPVRALNSANQAVPKDRQVLAQRIQGFGNVNPPPLEEESAGTMAKRAVRNLGGMVGEEVALTVQETVFMSPFWQRCRISRRRAPWEP